MERRTVQLKVAGQTYRVVTSASEDELRRLSDVVGSKLTILTPPGRPIQPQALLLAAISLAHDLEEERAKREGVERRARDLMRRVLVRIDAALDDLDGEEVSAEGVSRET